MEPSLNPTEQLSLALLVQPLHLMVVMMYRGLFKKAVLKLDNFLGNLDLLTQTVLCLSVIAPYRAINDPA